MIRGAGRMFDLGPFESLQPPVKPEPPPAPAPEPEPEPEFGFEDLFTRTIARTWEADTLADPAGDEHKAWGLSSDGSAQWSVFQSGNFFGFEFGNGVGVDGSAGYYVQTFGFDSPSLEMRVDAPVGFAARDTWTLETRFRFLVKTPMGSRTWHSEFGMQIALFDYEVALWLDWEFNGGTQSVGNNVELSDFGGATASPFTLPPMGTWINLKWERSISGGYSRVRLWADGDPEPSDWHSEDEPWADHGGIDRLTLDHLFTHVFGGSPPNPDDDEYIRIEWDYIRVIP